MYNDKHWFIRVSNVIVDQDCRLTRSQLVLLNSLAEYAVRCFFYIKRYVLISIGYSYTWLQLHFLIVGLANIEGIYFEKCLVYTT